MSYQKKCPPGCGQHHTNAFVILNGIPYLVAEYMDIKSYQAVDTSMVRSEIQIDQSECMQTIVDISIDDIGRKASNGSLNVIGNVTKTKSLINILKNNKPTDGILPVLKRGICVKINYQIENARTGQVLRTNVESFPIYDRSYFVAINGNNVNDNAIVVNFSNSAVSTVNQFTNGRDPLTFRITSINLYYDRVKGNKYNTRVQSLITDPNMMMEFYGSDADMYKYHKEYQSQHIMSSQCSGQYFNGTPTSWQSTNRFYHFDLAKKDIVIHDEEVYNTRTTNLVVPAGTVRVDRAFMVNPGCRIVFKLSIWKNDLVIVDDCTDIAKVLNGNSYPYFYDENTPRPHRCTSEPSCYQHNCFYNKPTCPAGSDIDYMQNDAINKLSAKIERITALLNNLNEGGEVPDDYEIDPLPESPDSVVDEPPCMPENPCCNPFNPCPPIPPHQHHPHGKEAVIRRLADKLNTLTAELNEMNETWVCNREFNPYTDDQIISIVQDAADEVFDDDGDPDPVAPGPDEP